MISLINCHFSENKFLIRNRQSEFCFPNEFWSPHGLDYMPQAYLNTKRFLATVLEIISPYLNLPGEFTRAFHGVDTNFISMYCFYYMLPKIRINIFPNLIRISFFYSVRYQCSDIDNNIPTANCNYFKFISTEKS